MLKAVRFDPEIHKELIEFVENYKDKRGKPNHSEAIRILMEKGFESLSNSTQNIEIKKVEASQPAIDLDKFRDDIVKQIWETIGKTVLTQNVPHAYAFTQINPNNQIQSQPQIEQIKEEPVKPAPLPKKTIIPANGNALLGNLLSNANR